MFKVSVFINATSIFLFFKMPLFVRVALLIVIKSHQKKGGGEGDMRGWGRERKGEQ